MAPRSAPARARSANPRQERQSKAPAQRLLYRTSDHGRPVTLDPLRFAPAQRGGGWGSFAESFERLNAAALAGLDVRLEFAAGSEGTVVRLIPAGKAGAIPLRSAQTGQVAGGLLVVPRFGWAGVGRVLAQTGWHARPDFLRLPLVPGSARAVPPWVLAGPVLARLTALLRVLRRDFQETEAVLQRPRGRILWDQYRTHSLARGHWDRLPCRYPDLAPDRTLRAGIRWAVERIRRDLLLIGGSDPIAMVLVALAQHMLEQLNGVVASKPNPELLRRQISKARVSTEALRSGLEALTWVVEERGLGGGRQSDGLAWSLSLEQLWESYVENIVRREAALTGAEVKAGRLGETVFRLDWSDPTHRSLGHLRPDFVIRRGRSLQIVDAKYKAHLAELDEAGWYRFTAEAREAHRADVHQALAYAALYDADSVTTVLVYPLRESTWAVLKRQERDISRATLETGGRSLAVELRGLPFGRLGGQLA